MYGTKGKGREGELSDSQLAAYLYREDLRRNVSILADRQMTRSIAQASQTDGEILTASLSEEQTVASDRQTACRLGGVADPNPTEEMDEELLAKLSAFYIQVPAEEGDFEYATIEAVSESEPESSSWAATRPTARSIYRRYIAYPRAHSIL